MTPGDRPFTNSEMLGSLGAWVGLQKHFKLTRNNVQAIKSKTGLYMQHRHGYFHTHRNLADRKRCRCKTRVYTDWDTQVCTVRSARASRGRNWVVNLDVKKIDSGERTSFEFSEWRVTYTSFRAKLIIIYRPPHSQVRNIQSPLVYSSRNSVPILSQSFCLQSRFYYLVTLIFI